MNSFHPSRLLCAATLGALTFLLGSSLALANDAMFPPAPSAKTAINFDGRGFMVNGKRTFIASGSLHYARVPRALWRDRLLKFKRAGINCVETYTFWNTHEPQPGQWNFSGDADLGAFLSLAQLLGMVAIVRVGPYYCAEWDSGGYPVWLRNVPGIEVRTDNAPFKREVGTFFDHLLPIVAAHQISRGGNVVMVQLENEHPRGWGTEMPDAYFSFLRDKFQAAGGEVPFFFSGLHHGSDPAGDRSWDSKERTNPWFTTEFWPGWYDLYGPLSAGNLRRFDRGTWKIIAYGGNGYNYYMLGGGTNFDYTNNNEDTASYDYGCAVGQAGDLRPIYYRFKRAATFATSFSDILENSENADAEFQNIASNAAVKVTARRSNAGTIAFLDNPGNTPIQTQISAPDGTKSAPVTLEAGEIMPVVQNFELAPGVKITSAPTRILGISRQGQNTTLVVYGQTGSPAEVHFSATGHLLTLNSRLIGPSGIGDTLTGYAFRTTFGAAPIEANFSVGTQHVRVLAVNSEMADRTWFIQANGANYIVTGPDFVGDVALQNNVWNISTQRPWNGGTANPTTVYGATTQILPPAAPFRGDRVTTAALANWQTSGGSAPAQPDFNDSKWMKSADPMQMGSDNDLSAYGWYRTQIKAPTTGKYTLNCAISGGNLGAFLDGKRVNGAVSGSELSLDLTAGQHTLALFASHNGRDKLFNHLGAISDTDKKGLSGPAFLTRIGNGSQTLSGWKMKAADGNATTPPAVDATWSNYSIGNDAFANQAGRAWFVATLPNMGVAGDKVLHFTSVDEEATVFLNGVKIGEHSGWNQGFDVSVGTDWKAGGPNQLAVLISNKSYTGGIDKPVSLLAYDYHAPITGWALRGGPKGADEKLAWKPFVKGAALAGPTWFRTTFTAPTSTTSLPIWRFIPRGLSRGSVWLNGHNLGRYPEKVPVSGLYLPENWLVNGTNTLEVFDEEGAAPDAATVEAEVGASRDLARIEGK